MTQLHEIDPTRTEWEAKDGAFYCPECGSRFDTAGVCVGTAESGHAAVPVEPVKAAKGNKTAEGKGKGKEDDKEKAAAEDDGDK